MPHRLLINADDFGLTPGINRAIVELHQAGALPSATLMANGPAFLNAAAQARQNPGLGVGCHVVLTDGLPVLAAGTIPSLLGKDRHSFRPSLTAFLTAVLLGRVHEAEMAREAEAQIRRLQNAGLRVTHLDTHKHTHVLPAVARALLTAAERTGVRALRNPFEPSWSLPIGRSGFMRRLQVALAARLRRRFQQLPAIRERRILTTDGTIGVSATGRLDRATLHKLLDCMPEGTWELVCHPGYNDHDLAQITTRLRESRDVERRALLNAFGAQPAASEVNAAPAHGSLVLLHFGALDSE